MHKYSGTTMNEALCGLHSRFDLFLFCLFSYNTNWTLRLYLQIHLVKRISQQRSTQRKFSQLVSVIVTLTCCSKSPDSSVPNGAMISLLMS